MFLSELAGGRAEVDVQKRPRQVAGVPVSESLLWVGVQPEVPNSQAGSHSLTSVRGSSRVQAAGSALVHLALSLTQRVPFHQSGLCSTSSPYSAAITVILYATLPLTPHPICHRPRHLEQASVF